MIMISPPVTSVSASIEVESGRDGTFRVQCISSGGRALDMYVTGPGGPYSNLNIQAVGTPQRKGSDSFFATTSIISGGSNGDTYQCLALNGVSPSTANNIELRGICGNAIPCDSHCMQAAHYYFLSSC